MYKMAYNRLLPQNGEYRLHASFAFGGAIFIVTVKSVPVCHTLKQDVPNRQQLRKKF